MNLLKLPGIVWRRHKMMRQNKGLFPLEEILSSPLPTTALADLGAFKRPLQQIPKRIETIVLMDERASSFFLPFGNNEPRQYINFNKHGPLRNYHTHEDLVQLVGDLHNQGKKVLIGFWAFYGDGISRPTYWLKKHPELRPRRWGESDIGNLFAVLQPEKIGFAEYVAQQYLKLHKAFGFDGLFLGDGFCGLRSFWHPGRYRYSEFMAKPFAQLYCTIAAAVHKTGGQLWSYDCMGFSFEEAREHGADYFLLANAGLDVLVFQSYPTAWGYYMKIPGKESFQKSIIFGVNNLWSIKGSLRETKTKVFYTLELGDGVEGWHPMHVYQMGTFDPISDGRVLVWANDLLAKLL